MPSTSDVHFHLPHMHTCAKIHTYIHTTCIHVTKRILMRFLDLKSFSPPLLSITGACTSTRTPVMRHPLKPLSLGGFIITRKTPLWRWGQLQSSCSFVQSHQWSSLFSTLRSLYEPGASVVRGPGACHHCLSFWMNHSYSSQAAWCQQQMQCCSC